MSSVRYGNFLSSKRIGKNNLEIAKPTIGTVVDCFFTLTLGLLFSCCVFIGYENVFGSDIDTTVSAKYKEAKDLSLEVNRLISVSKEVRPNKLDVIGVVENFASSRPKNVFFTNITVDSGKYSLSGNAKTIYDSDAFVKSLNFGNNKSVILTKISSHKGNKDIKSTVDFTVEVVDRAKTKPAAANANDPASKTKEVKK